MLFNAVTPQGSEMGIHFVSNCHVVHAFYSMQVEMLCCFEVILLFNIKKPIGKQKLTLKKNNSVKLIQLQGEIWQYLICTVWKEMLSTILQIQTTINRLNSSPDKNFHGYASVANPI